MSRMARAWTRLGPEFLPFADAASAELPLGRLLRLSLFQVSVGMGSVLLIGTLNRVMIVELGVAAWLVASMVSLPLLFAPVRALIGHRSDNHCSALGWRRVPYIWMGTLLQFGGLAIMPFALILLSGDSNAPPVVAHIAAAAAFLLVGAGLHTTQTVGLALATDLAPPDAQPRVVALLSLMLLLGMVVSAVGFGALLQHFSQIRLIQVIQGAALATMLLNGIALWKQESRNPNGTRHGRPQPGFLESWRRLRGEGRWARRLTAIGLGSAAFSMQDILLEPYGGQILGLSVAATTTLTALFAGGGIAGFGMAARGLGHGMDAHRLAGFGALAGALGFAGVIFAAPLDSPVAFGIGTVVIGLGSGLFTVGTLTACMELARTGQAGLALGAWGAVQASCAGGAIAAGGLLRDIVSDLAMRGAFGGALTGAATGYGAVYLLEIVLLFVTIAVIGPLVRVGAPRPASPLGLAGSPS
ncbi:BCD family MFS transporter [Belnapia rosea]|uniref:BCD family MFS transporter n=1 Tax=Belnapia rosea TaxID=938405 RepID=UPI00088E6024|nr:BCD family MFS transporter [Belnapia rosea]SDB70967.1 MFS transporter, BCD family, chlorophyll transporter [Belnapia rosea]